MALVLSLKEGQDFYVGDQQFVIDAIHADVFFRIKHPDSGRTFEVSNTRATEVLDDVFVSAGDKPMAQSVRVAIEAPANLLVLRGPKYRGETPALDEQPLTPMPKKKEQSRRRRRRDRAYGANAAG